MKKVIVIGGGPSGMMAAISAKTNFPSYDVKLLERNKILGQKLRLTGGGRCNVTADVSNEDVIKSVPKNGRFLYSSLMNFSPKEIINFFNTYGPKLKKEDHERMFPITDKAVDIITSLQKHLFDIGVDVHFNAMVKNIDIDKMILETDNKKFSFDHLIIATGGKTLPQSGSDGNMYEFLESIGHKITELIPAEVPLVSNDQVIQEKTLQGLSFKDVKVSVYNDKKVVRTITHDLLFTHFGISGPAALRASFDVLELLKTQKEVVVAIDFIKDDIINDQIIRDEMIEKVIEKYELPKRLITYLKSVTNNNYELYNMLKNFKLVIYTTRGFASAFVTNGGIDLKQVNPKTMQSKLYPFISFCGELLDINAYTGGFNITSAFSTGYTAGMYLD